ARTGRACPAGPRAARRARDARCRRRHATWDRLASRPGPVRRFSVVRLLQLLQDAVDVLRVLESAIQMKMQLRTRAQMQLFRELRPQNARGTRESLHRLRLFLFGGNEASADVRVA